MLTGWIINGVTIECVRGNIIEQHGMDAIVNAANAELRPGGGVAGAIHRAAGPELERECQPLAPIRPGQAVLTYAHRLPNRYVIHCLGPVYGRDEPSSELLAACYRKGLRVADHYELSSIAFPAISTGAFGYPRDAAARVAIETIMTEARHLRKVRHIRMVLFEEADLLAHCRALERLIGSQQSAAAAPVKPFLNS